MLARITLAVLYAVAGLAHLLIPGPFLSVTPRWVPSPEAVIAITGLAELAGAAGLIQTNSLQTRRWAGWGLALYALCVWPANLLHMQIDMAKPDGGLGLAYHIPRMLAQPLIIWWALWASGAIGRCRHG
ncbi:DoxX family protein [Novosphingobium sp. RD2P27]|uniref:DoxX family protein n=1 Tax=Novosphingobium kalidii TaxID=3230299 RepID=A0ABV2D5F5_9SPHN